MKHPTAILFLLRNVRQFGAERVKQSIVRFRVDPAIADDLVIAATNGWI